MTYSSTLTSKGQVTIPVSVRRKLGISAGQSVNFTINPKGEVLIEKNDWQQQLEALQKELQADLKKRGITPLTDEELDQAINDAAEAAANERYLRSLQ